MCGDEERYVQHHPRIASTPIHTPVLWPPSKMETLFRLMREMRSTGDDRIVVVSNFTSSLDLIGAMCRENGW